MTDTIYRAPVCKMEELNNLFIEMTAKNCNMRCKNCYIDFPLNKNVKDFIPVEIVKKAIYDTQEENIQCIYLMGAEPMTHPDFNTILRMCLKRANVCIFTNGTFINEKKARFLKRVQDEGTNEIIFKLSIDHYDEIKNDEVRCRGSYRAVVNALKNLVKYDFNPIVCITNFYNEPKEIMIKEFKNIFKRIGFETHDNNFVINNNILKQTSNEDIIIENFNIDCTNGRTLTAKGVYTCPFLANDYRGRCGGDFSDFSTQNSLETNYCNQCVQNKEKFFTINYNLFK